MRIGEQDMRFVTTEEELRKNAGNPKEKISLVQTEIKKWDCPFSGRMITRQLYKNIEHDKMPSEKMLEDLQKIGITADRIVKISNLKK
jgi:hypothetical protein